MKQRTHTWLALRAIALLEDEGETPNLVRLLKPHARGAAIGSWIPDMADSKKGFGDIDNHIFKLKPYNRLGKSRFVRSRNKTLNDLGGFRRMRQFILDHGEILGEDWWKQAYRADPPPGQHLANRSMALSTALIDQLILGDPKVAELVPGIVRFAHRLSSRSRPRPEEIATYCFMLSHFMADACQPFHCDARPMAGYSAGVHKELEAHWNKLCGTYFEKKKLLATTDRPDTILKRSRDVEAKTGIRFSNRVPDLNARDLWQEVIYICRGSFAISSILVPPSVIPYGSNKRTRFAEVFEADEQARKRLADLDAAVLHDSVLNIAMAWKNVWATFH